MIDIQESLYQSILEYEKNQPCQGKNMMLCVARVNYRYAKKSAKRFNQERKREGKSIRCTVVHV